METAEQFQKGESLQSRRANRNEDLPGFADFNCRFQDDQKVADMELGTGETIVAPRRPSPDAARLAQQLFAPTVGVVASVSCFFAVGSTFTRVTQRVIPAFVAALNALWSGCEGEC